MSGRRASTGQASVEMVGLWAVVVAMFLTVGALLASEVVIRTPQPRAIERVAGELNPPAWVAPASDPRPGIGSRLTGELARVGLDGVRFRESLRREYEAGFLDRLQQRGREAREDPLGVLEEILSYNQNPGRFPRGVEDVEPSIELVRYAERIARMEPGDAARALSRDLGELTADELIRRALRAGGRRATGGRRRTERRDAPPGVQGPVPVPTAEEIRELRDLLGQLR